MIEWFLVVLVAGNTSGLVPVSRHLTREDCRQQLAVEVVHQAVVGRPVEFATCQPYRLPQPRPVTGDIQTR